jgi:hypothetical protein
VTTMVGAQGLGGAFSALSATMVSLSPAILAVGAAFAGLKIGEWISQLEGMPKWLQQVIDWWYNEAAATRQAKAATQEMEQSITSLAEKLKQHGIVVDRTATSTDEYRKMLMFAVNHVKELEGAGDGATKTIREMMASTKATTSALGDYAETTFKAAEATRWMTMSEILNKVAHDGHTAAVTASFKAIVDWLSVTEPMGKQLELHASNLDNAAAAAYRYGLALQVASDQYKPKQYEDVVGPVQWNTKGTTLSVILDPNSSVNLKNAAKEAQERAYELRDLWQAGKGTQEDYERAQKKATEAEKVANGETLKHIKTVQTLGMQMSESMRRGIEDLERGLASNIVHWKGWADTIKSFGQNLATDFLSIMMKGLFQPLENQLAKLAGRLVDVIGGALGIGGGAASGAASAASSGASAAGSAASATSGKAASGASGLLGAVGAIGSVVSAVSGVIGNFQNAKMETTMNAVEGNTRRTAITLGEGEDGISNNLKRVWFSLQYQSAAWDTFLGQSYKLIDIHAVLSEMRDLMKGGGQVRALSASSSPSFAGAGNVNIYITNSDPGAVLKEITTKLKRLGIRP